MIVCGLPDSGRGAGGTISVQTTQGKSNQRILSIFNVLINRWYEAGDSHSRWLGGFGLFWNLHWRFDIGFQTNGADTEYLFEVGKSSFGGPQPGSMLRALIPWTDSSSIKDSSLSCFGTMDIKSSLIKFKTISMRWTSFGYHDDDSFRYTIPPITFDSSGTIFSLSDSIIKTPYYSEKITDNVSGYILFPPSPKSSVSQHLNESNADLIKISYDFSSGNQTIGLEALKPLGEVTASLFGIDGRLLRKASINMAEPGFYEFDASGIDHQIGLLLLQSELGCSTKKILF